MTKDQEAALFEIQNSLKDGWCTHEKAVRLFDLVYDNKLKLCLEIGTFGGRSLIAMAFALRELGDGLIFGIDPWKVDACLEGTNDKENNQWWSQVDWNRIIANYFDKLQELNLLQHSCHLRKHDTQCLGLFSNNSLDIVHFDSNHSEEVSCRTLNDWWPKIKSNGFVVMDDINWKSQKNTMKLLKSKSIETVDEYETYGIYRKK